MILNLYNNTSQPNVVNKTITLLSSLNITPLDDLNVGNPDFIIKYNPAFVKANYAYVEELGRYYFIDNVTLLTGGRMSIKCSVDVLMTYKDDILSSTAVVIRNQGIGRPTMVDDKSYPMNPNRIFLNSIGLPKQPILSTGNNVILGVRN